MQNKTVNQMQQTERWLIALVILFIAVGLAIGGMNAALGKAEDGQLKEKVHTIYLLYETLFRTGVVIAASVLSLRLMRLNQERTKMRQQNLVSFSLFMTFALVIVPALTGLLEITIAVMPLPWSSMPLQLLKDGFFFSTRLEQATVSSLLAIYLGYQAVVFVGTLLLGRRFHCSMICPFSGAHAESFSMALPLLGRKRRSKADQRVKRWMPWLKYGLFAGSVLLLGMMAIDVFAGRQLLDFAALRQIEMLKYLVFEITLMQVLYVAYNGRGYCHYCPAGTVIGLLARVAGQRIETNQADCIGCGICNRVCEMGLDIKAKARSGQALESFGCLGCGHCVDRCPTETLGYSTAFLRFRRSRQAPVGSVRMGEVGETAREA